jgi:glutaconate CoA-transferase, subunit B
MCVVTPSALFDFDERTHRMRLIATTPSVKIEKLLAEIAFELFVSASVDEMPPPTPDELMWLRERLDPNRLVIGKGNMIRS